MKNDKIIPGIILVLIGAAILLANFGYLHFQWYNIFHLWPIFLVIGGVNLVLANNKTLWAGAIKIAVLVIGLGLLFFGDFGDRYNFWPRHHFNFRAHQSDDNNNMDNDDDDDNDNDNSGTIGSHVFNQPMTGDVKLAHLNINGGATAFYLSDSTNLLFSANTNDDRDRFNFSGGMEDSVYVVNFKMKDHHGFNFDSDNDQRVNMMLNVKPVWMVDIDAGAAKVDFDLSRFKVRSLNIRGGAAAFDVKLGQPLDNTDVRINTGVSAVNVKIPMDAACRIESNSGLSGNDFNGFSKTHDNVYETPNFASARNKLYIHISGGLSGFDVSRY
ncbi:MAG TPA: DUF5668 domain-containing protein [Mucilaginibacter sp.]|nr:DUF5668 domain-containing protein [Mucilaginibacter sp.]